MTNSAIYNKLFQISSGNVLIYIATRLFDYIQKIKAELIEEHIYYSIEAALKPHNLPLNKNIVFVPFRDTKEHEIIGDEKTRIIYENDLQRLSANNLLAVIATFNDISKDEGIAFEIGYVYNRKIPVFLFVTDFIWYALRSNPKIEFIVDPVILNMTYKLIHHYTIPSNVHPFKRQLEVGLDNAFKQLENEFYNYIINDSKEELQNLTDISVDNDIFIDFAGGKCLHHRESMDLLSNELLNTNQRVLLSNRFSPENENENVLERGKNDINSLLSSKISIFSANEPEMDSGSAALLGLSKSTNKTVILYYTGNIVIHGEGQHKMIKNLMIDFSVDYICSSINEILDVIKYINNDEF